MVVEQLSSASITPLSLAQAPLPEANDNGALSVGNSWLTGLSVVLGLGLIAGCLGLVGFAGFAGGWFWLDRQRSQ